MLWFSLALASTAWTAVRAVTVYGQIPLAQTATAGYPKVTLAAYDTTVLTPPPVPNPPPASAYTLNLQRNAAQVNGLSIPHVGGSFWGFSIEMSVVGQVCESLVCLCLIPDADIVVSGQKFVRQLVWLVANVLTFRF